MHDAKSPDTVDCGRRFPPPHRKQRSHNASGKVYEHAGPRLRDQQIIRTGVRGAHSGQVALYVGKRKKPKPII